MKSMYKRIITALFLIAIGIFLLMHNLHLLPFELPAYVFSWKMLLIVLGVFFLIRLKPFPGIILLGVGSFFIAPEAFNIPHDRMHALWPLLLVLLGIAVLFMGPCKKPKKKSWKQFKHGDKDGMNSVVIFGNETKKVSSYDFKGGNIVAIFGGIEIDLTDCYLNKEDNELNLVAVMGGITLTVPKEWNITTDVVQVMGGIDVDSKPGDYVDPAAQLNVKGVAVMGGVEIKRI